MGGLDEDFFAHMEEIDLCWRCQRAGYKTAYVSRSVVYHLGGGTLKDTNPYKTYLNFRNGLQLLVKNSSFASLVWKFPIRIVLDIIAGIRFLLLGSFQHFTAVVRAEIKFFINLPRTWNKRRLNRSSYNAQLFNSLVVWDFFIRGKKTFRAIAQTD
jgi:GT2 family glycosyltransferase